MYPKKIISGDFKSDILFIFLILPLGIPSFFHPGTTPLFRPVVSSFELLFVFVFAFYYLNKESVFYLPRTGMFVLTGWAVWACLAVFFSDHPVASILRQWEWFCKILFSFSLWVYLKDNQYRLVQLQWMIIIGILLICIGYGVLWCVLLEPVHYNWIYEGPFFTNIRHFSYLLAAGTVLSVFLIVTDHDENLMVRFMSAFLVLSIFWGFLFWVGGRGGIIASMAGCLFAGLFFAKKKRLFFSILFVSVVTGFILSLFFKVDSITLGLANAFVRSGADVSSGRFVFWAEALHNVKNSLLFGLGPDSFRFFPSLEKSIIQPHNSLIQGVLEWGIPGAILFAWFQLIMIYKGFVRIIAQKQTPLYDIKVTALSLIAGYLCYGLVDGVYYHAIPLSILAYAFAVILLPETQGFVATSFRPGIPVKRSGIRVIAMLLVFVCCLQFTVSKIVASGNIPDPLSIKGRLVRFFPSDTRGLERWVMMWKKTDPKLALTASIKFAQDSSPSDAFWRAASIIALEQGDLELAKQFAQKAVQNSFVYNRDKLKEEFQAHGFFKER